MEKEKIKVARAADLGESARRAAKRAAFPVALAVFSFAVSASSPALGATPIGPALLSAAPSLVSALPVLTGALLSSFRLGAAAAPFALIMAALFVFRLALGALGGAKTKAVDGKYFAPLRLPEPLDDAVLIKLNSAFNTSLGVRCATAFGAAAALGAANVFSGENFWYEVFGSALSSTLAPLFCLAVSALAEPGANVMLRKSGVGVLLYTVVLSLGNVTVGGVNIALTVSLFASLAAGRTLGVSDGALMGAFAGLALDAGSMGMMPVAAMCSGALSAYSAGAAAISSSILGMSWALAANGVAAVSSTLPEVTIAAALFYPAARFSLIPEDFSLFAKSPPKTPHGKTGSVGDRMREVADAMSETSKIISKLSSRLSRPDREELVSLCEREFAPFCSSCPKAEWCRPSDGRSVRRDAESAAEALSERGRVDASSFDPETVRRCPSVDRVIDGINSSYAKLIDDALDGKTEVISRDFSNFSDMIKGLVDRADEECERNSALSDALEDAFCREGIGCASVSVYGKNRPEVYARGLSVKDLSCGAADLRRIAEDAVGSPLSEPEMSLDGDALDMYLAPKRALFPKYGSYSAPATPGEANGDAVLSFSGGGYFFAAVCDGMGSGREAALTARASAVFLRRMLGAGCGEREALRLLNDFTRERSIECFSTVDLLKIDPYSGEALFVKSGAAPSFVYRAGKLFRIECSSSPIGILERVGAKTVKFSLEEGDVVVLVSDGALPDGDAESWLYEYLSDGKNLRGDPPAVAKRIAREASSRAASRDDTTVGVIRIDSAA